MTGRPQFGATLNVRLQPFRTMGLRKGVWLLVVPEPRRLPPRNSGRVDTYLDRRLPTGDLAPLDPCEQRHNLRPGSAEPAFHGQSNNRQDALSQILAPDR